MSRRIIDATMFFDEFDILEMRLMELYEVVDDFIVVEADVDHQGKPKPYHLTDDLGAERWAPYLDKLVVVQATNLPGADEYPDPWAREHAQREWIGEGLITIGAGFNDILMQSDLDEIPTALVARNINPGNELVTIGMRGHFFAVDWWYPPMWHGTVAGSVRTVLAASSDRPFVHMRDVRMTARVAVPDGGWHFSWLGGPDRAKVKVDSFCHPEVADQIDAGIADDFSFWREGIHVDGTKMVPIDVDSGWPKFITEGHAPDSWYRPR